MHKRAQSEVKPRLIEERVLTDSGDLLTRKYQLGRFLGKGGFASCFELCALDTQQTYAAKVVLKQTLQHSSAKRKLLAEIQLHKTLQHNGIVRFDHHFEDTERIYMLLELCVDNLEDVLRRRQRLSELEVQTHVKQLLSTLQYLHSSGIVHRDLKLANLFIASSMALKLGDFGLATHLNSTHERRRTMCGTPNYMAPEVLDPRLGHSFQADLWSLGVLIYTLIVGVPPFETEDLQTTYARIRQAVYTYPEQLQVSQPCKDLIAGLLVVDPEQRFSLVQVQECNFLNPHYEIPSLLPVSSLTNPLSLSFVEEALSQRQQPKEPPQALFSDDELGTIWVSKWLNLSAKYGLGYLLNNGVSGVSFNDHSCLLQSGQFLTYVCKRAVPQTFSAAQPPQHLVKKVTLLQQFQRFLAPQTHSPAPLLYVSKWIQANQAVLFRLSNRVIQVIFKDKAEVLLSADASQLTFVNSEGVRTCSALDQASDEARTRLELTRELIGQLLTRHTC